MDHDDLEIGKWSQAGGEASNALAIPPRPTSLVRKLERRFGKRSGFTPVIEALEDGGRDLERALAAIDSLPFEDGKVFTLMNRDLVRLVKVHEMTVTIEGDLAQLADYACLLRTRIPGPFKRRPPWRKTHPSNPWVKQRPSRDLEPPLNVEKLGRLDRSPVTRLPRMRKRPTPLSVADVSNDHLPHLKRIVRDVVRDSGLPVTFCGGMASYRPLMEVSAGKPGLGGQRITFSASLTSEGGTAVIGPDATPEKTLQSIPLLHLLEEERTRHRNRMAGAGLILLLLMPELSYRASREAGPPEIPRPSETTAQRVMRETRNAGRDVLRVLGTASLSSMWQVVLSAPPPEREKPSPERRDSGAAEPADSAAFDALPVSTTPGRVSPNDAAAPTVWLRRVLDETRRASKVTPPGRVDGSGSGERWGWLPGLGKWCVAPIPKVQPEITEINDVDHVILPRTTPDFGSGFPYFTPYRYPQENWSHGLWPTVHALRKDSSWLTEIIFEVPREWAEDEVVTASWFVDGSPLVSPFLQEVWGRYLHEQPIPMSSWVPEPPAAAEWFTERVFELGPGRHWIEIRTYRVLLANDLGEYSLWKVPDYRQPESFCCARTFTFIPGRAYRALVEIGERTGEPLSSTQSPPVIESPRGR